MKALDTNALVRFLVRDDELQAEKVRDLLRKGEKNGEPFFIPFAVTLETIWVLSSAYHLSKDEIIDVLDHLLVLTILEIEQRERIARACDIARGTDAGLADVLIGVAAGDNGCETTLTFDKKAARLPLFTLIS